MQDTRLIRFRLIVNRWLIDHVTQELHVHVFEAGKLGVAACLFELERFAVEQPGTSQINLLEPRAAELHMPRIRAFELLQGLLDRGCVVEQPIPFQIDHQPRALGIGSLFETF